MRNTCNGHVTALTDGVFTPQADWLHVSFYACTVCGAIYLLLLICLRSRIAIAVRVMKEATRAVGALPLMLLLPLLTLGLVVALLSYGLLVLLLLISCGELQYGRSGFGAPRPARPDRPARPARRWHTQGESSC